VRVRRLGLTKNLGGPGIDGRDGGRHGREKRVFFMEGPSIGLTSVRSAPQRFPPRCVGASMGERLYGVDKRRQSYVCGAWMTCSRAFRPYAGARTLPPWTLSNAMLESMEKTYKTREHGHRQLVCKSVQAGTCSRQTRRISRACPTGWMMCADGTRWLISPNASEECITMA
jgi:hypothetical protein